MEATDISELCKTGECDCDQSGTFVGELVKHPLDSDYDDVREYKCVEGCLCCMDREGLYALILKLEKELMRLQGGKGKAGGVE